MEVVVDMGVLHARFLGSCLPIVNSLTHAAVLALLDISEALTCVERISVNLGIQQLVGEDNAHLMCTFLGFGFEFGDAVCAKHVMLHLYLTPVMGVVESCSSPSSDSHLSTSTTADVSDGCLSGDEGEDWQ
jgi:hypothetical protein